VASSYAVTRHFIVLFYVAVGVLYESLVAFGWGAMTPRFPTPYAVPIFDVPFALVAVGIGYLCLERHRLRQDARSAGMGTTLWLTALLALSHVLAQPDYPANPGVNAGIAPYFFFLSYFAGLAGIGLAAHCGERSFPLTARGRLAIGAAVVVLTGVLMTIVLHVRPLLPPVAAGRFTPFGLGAGYFVLATAGVWALSGGLRRYAARDPFGGYFLLAAFIWILGLLGFLLHPVRYSIPWYLAGFARPLGVGVIFVGLLREQVWLYREARARQRDLDVLHRAGHALVRSLDLGEIADTIATKAVEVSGADGAILFRFDARDRVLLAMSRAGAISDSLVSGLALPLGQGASGVSVAERRPVFTTLLADDPAVPFPRDVVTRMRREGLRSVLAVPLTGQTGEIYGALSVFYLRQREFTPGDVELLSAFGTQASVAIQNGRSFDALGRRARHDEHLHDFAQHLLELTNADDIRDETVRLTREALDADVVGLFLFDVAGECLRLEAGVGWQPDTVGALSILPSTDSFAGYTFLRKTLVQVEDLAAERRFAVPAHLTAHGIQAGVAVPLGVRDQPTGVLAVYYRAPRRLSDEDGRVLASIAHQTALALEKARLYAELQARLRELQQTQDQLIQADKLKALGTLLSGVAHELNNPLSTILGSAQLLQGNGTLPDAVRKRIGVIESECERAARIIRELLAFARRRPPERRHVDLNDIVRGTLQLQAPDFGLSRIRVVTSLGVLPRIAADPHQLQQVLLNLFTNATHAMKSIGRDGLLTVQTVAHDDAVAIVVEDNGPGIPAEHLRRVFDPFFTTKAAGEGTGLGLSLCIGIVEAHGGRISVENLPGAGARFTIHLPIGEQIGVTEDPHAAVAPPQSAEILIIEDEAALRGLFVDILREHGHQVAAAATGRTAIELLEHTTYDVIVLDLRLPDIDGKAVWEWIVGHRPALAARVVFMTGDTLSATTQRFLEQAGRPVLHKPVTIDRLRRTLGEVLAPTARAHGDVNGHRDRAGVVGSAR
jgi:signal transduction histidine kinase/CheY-like chemotaxis protein